MIMIGNIKEVITPRFKEEVLAHAQIFFEKNPRGRTLKQVREQTLYGDAVELLVCRFLKLNRSAFAISHYDGTDGRGRKYEIKHTTIDSKYWNYDPGTYSHFLRNAHNLDFIVLCYVDKETNNVFIKFKADAKTFAANSNDSQYNAGQKYYKHTLAANKGQCEIY